MNPKPRHLYTAFMLLLCLFLAYMLAAKNWLQTDLTALLPQEQQPDVVLQAADEANEAQLNTQVVLLAGSADAEKAFQAAAEIADLWRKSGVFAEVDSSISPDLEQVRGDMQRLGLAVLPHEQRQQLFEDPQQYFQQRAEAAVNPFAAPSPLSLEQDWLGFGRFVSARAQPQSRLQWNADNGMLFTEDEAGKTWVWLRGKLPQTNNIANGSEGLLPLLQQSREQAAKAGVETLSAGGAVYAAASKAAASKESRLMSAAGLLLTFTLLLWVFRSVRVFWLVVPLAAGMLTGGRLFQSRLTNENSGRNRKHALRPAHGPGKMRRQLRLRPALGIESQRTIRRQPSVVLPQRRRARNRRIQLRADSGQ